MDTLLVFVTYWKHFSTLTTKVWNHNFFCNSVMNLTAGEHSSTLVFGPLVTTVTGVKIKVSKLTVIFMPSIIQVYFHSLSNNCSLTCFTSSLSTSMFFVIVVWFIVVISMNSFLVIFFEILRAFFTWIVKPPFEGKHLYCCLVWIFIHLCNFHKFFSEKMLVHRSYIYFINGRLKAVNMSKDTHLL